MKYNNKNYCSEHLTNSNSLFIRRISCSSIYTTLQYKNSAKDRPLLHCFASILKMARQIRIHIYHKYIGYKNGFQLIAPAGEHNFSSTKNERIYLESVESNISIVSWKEIKKKTLVAWPVTNENLPLANSNHVKADNVHSLIVHLQSFIFAEFALAVQSHQPPFTNIRNRRTTIPFLSERTRSQAIILRKFSETPILWLLAICCCLTFFNNSFESFYLLSFSIFFYFVFSLLQIIRLCIFKMEQQQQQRMFA